MLRHANLAPCAAPGRHCLMYRINYPGSDRTNITVVIWPEPHARRPPDQNRSLSEATWAALQSYGTGERYDKATYNSYWNSYSWHFSSTEVQPGRSRGESPENQRFRILHTLGGFEVRGKALPQRSGPKGSKTS